MGYSVIDHHRVFGIRYGVGFKQELSARFHAAPCLREALQWVPQVIKESKVLNDVEEAVVSFFIVVIFFKVHIETFKEVVRRHVEVRHAFASQDFFAEKEIPKRTIQTVGRNNFLGPFVFGLKRKHAIKGCDIKHALPAIINPLVPHSTDVVPYGFVIKARSYYSLA